MDNLGLIIIFTLLVSLASLVLVSSLLLHKTFIYKISFFLVSFAAGSLLATGFLDTMSEAVEQAGNKVFLWVTLSIAIFYLIERSVLFLHHHDEEGSHESIKMPTSFLLFGDGLHNFIDGASIAAAFLSSFQLGLITSLAVFIHEIPHELGDFGLLLQKNYSRQKVVLFNFFTGLAAIAGALLAYYLGSLFNGIVPLLLAITTGNFIYLSTIDLLPEIHHRHQNRIHLLMHSLAFFCGILLIVLLIQLIG